MVGAKVASRLAGGVRRRRSCWRQLPLRGQAGRRGQFAFSGVYTEVTPYSRLVHTEIFEPTASGATADDVPLIVTVTFEERDGKTHVVSHSLCPSKEVRDTIIASGMEHGMRESMDQLDELAATLAQSEGRVAK